MEQLTSHPNIVNIYAHCANTVLSEYVGRELDEIIYFGNNLTNSMTIATTQLDRVHLALQAVKGLEALHQLGVAHADIQPKQFLVGADNNSNVLVKLNDFNRCRFVLVHNTSEEEPCPFAIPSSPGASRSPEEYKTTSPNKTLTVAIDMYSFGHVLYGILTGKDIDVYENPQKTFALLTPAMYREQVSKGIHPKVSKDIFQSEGFGDDALLNVLGRVYELEPKKRATSQQIRIELENVYKKLLLLQRE